MCPLPDLKTAHSTDVQETRRHSNTSDFHLVYCNVNHDSVISRCFRVILRGGWVGGETEQALWNGCSKFETIHASLLILLIKCKTLSCFSPCIRVQMLQHHCTTVLYLCCHVYSASYLLFKHTVLSDFTLNIIRRLLTLKNMSNFTYFAMNSNQYIRLVCRPWRKSLDSFENIEYYIWVLINFINFVNYCQSDS